jgi:hypothetical protein
MVLVVPDLWPCLTLLWESELMSASEHHRKGNRNTASEQDILLEDFTAELTSAAYAVVLRHGGGNQWLDLELDLWRALTDTVQKWRRGSPPGSEGAFVCDWAGGQSEAVRGDVRDGH